jgi:hypothetical protein
MENTKEKTDKKIKIFQEIPLSSQRFINGMAVFFIGRLINRQNLGSVNITTLL